MHTDVFSERSRFITPGEPQPHLQADYSVHPGDSADAPSAGAQIASIVAEKRELSAEIEQLRSERNRLLETQRRIIELIGGRSPETIVHDLRNILNERDLLRALVNEM